MAKIELFDIRIVLDNFSQNKNLNRDILPVIQLNDLMSLELPIFPITRETAQVNISKGVEFLVRSDCFRSFKSSPLFIYFCTKNEQKICGAGVDISPLFIDAFRKSGEPQKYKTALDLENRYKEIIGNVSFRMSVTHISSNIDDCKCISDDNDAEKQNIFTQNTETDNFGIQANTQTSASKNRKSRAKQQTRIFPTLPDLLNMYNEYNTLENDFQYEATGTNDKAQTILQARRIKKMKKIQELRRKADVGQNLSEVSGFSQITSSNATFETPSDFSDSEETVDVQDLLREIRRELNIASPNKKKKAKPQLSEEFSESDDHKIMESQEVYVKPEVNYKKPKEKPLKEIGPDTLNRLNKKAKHQPEEKKPEKTNEPRRKPTHRLEELALRKPEPVPEKPTIVDPQPQAPKKKPPIILKADTIKRKKEEERLKNLSLKPKAQTQKDPIRQKPTQTRKQTTSPAKKTTKTKDTTNDKTATDDKHTTDDKQTTTIDKKDSEAKIVSRREKEKIPTKTDSGRFPVKGKAEVTGKKSKQQPQEVSQKKTSQTKQTNPVNPVKQQKNQTIKGKDPKEATDDTKPIKTKIDAGDKKKQSKKKKQVDSFGDTITYQSIEVEPQKSIISQNTTNKEDSFESVSKSTAKEKSNEETVFDSFESSKIQEKAEKSNSETIVDSFISDSSKVKNKDDKSKEEIVIDSFASESSKPQGNAEKSKEEIIIDSFASESTKTEVKVGEKDEIPEKESTSFISESSKLNSDIEIVDSSKQSESSDHIGKNPKSEVVDSFVSDTEKTIKESSSNASDKSKQKEETTTIVDSFVSDTEKTIKEPSSSASDKSKSKDESTTIVDSFNTTDTSIKQDTTTIDDSFETTDSTKQIPLQEEKIDSLDTSSKKKSDSSSLSTKKDEKSGLSSYSSLGEPVHFDGSSISDGGSHIKRDDSKSDSDSSFGFSTDDGSDKEKDPLIATLTNDQEKELDEEIQGDDLLSLMHTENIKSKKDNQDDQIKEGSTEGDSIISSFDI